MTFPTDEQAQYLNSGLDENIYLSACPGSGKTEVIAVKVTQEISCWNRFPSGIAVLTFSNSATDELKDRLEKHHGRPVSYPHVISTFDSFLLTHIVSHVAAELTGYSGRPEEYRFRVVDNSSSIFLTKGKFQGQRVAACKFDYDMISKGFVFSTGQQFRDRLLNAQDVNHEQFTDLANTKASFLKRGFGTYRDVELLAIKAFRDKANDELFRRLAKRFPVLVVDECQDLSSEQLFIIEKLLGIGIYAHFVGDLNQSIYGFRRSDPKRVAQFLTRMKFSKLSLTSNWRSGQGVVDLCSGLVNVERSEGNPNVAFLAPVILQYTKCPSELVPKFLEVASKYKNVVVVARGYGTLRRFSSGASELSSTEELALACVLISQKEFKSIALALELFSAWLTSVLDMDVRPNSLGCPADVESKVTWRFFLYDCLKYMVVSGASDPSKTWKEWAMVAKTALRVLPNQDFMSEIIRKNLDGLQVINLKAPNGKGDQPLATRLNMRGKQPDSNIRFSTIHQVKGETHDATIVVSGLKLGTDSNWLGWITDPSNEAARFAYVASSRPRHLLIWAVKKLKAHEVEMLKARGFEIA